ncbi:MAG: filamentous hemagglutinin family protein, partial [Alphaproteobacteria bacterium]
MAKYYAFKKVALYYIPISMLGVIGIAYANPEDGQVVSGSATIELNGKKLDIHQQTDKAVIDWRRFDIEVDEHTQFHQPSSNAATVNRVHNTDPSRIMGKLTANGNIILVNPNGVFFGKDSVVDVNGLIATTADINTQDFMDGKLKFNKPGNPNATILNEGLITAKEAGLVGLVAPNVINNGIILAKSGIVHLASGDTMTVDLYGDGLLEISMSDAVKSQLVSNGGLIINEGGEIFLTAAAGRKIVDSLIHVEGELHAPVIEQKGGKIIIRAESNLEKSATVITQNALISAAGYGEGQQGGIVEILADNVAIFDGTVIDTSGHSSSRVSMAPIVDDGGSAALTSGKQVRTEAEFLKHENRAGGSIKIGGDYLGTGDTQRANKTIIAPDTLILNDAINEGDAGRTIIWSDDVTDFGGTVLSRASKGNAGFVETSGKNILNATGHVEADLWLLDPNNIT